MKILFLGDSPYIDTGFGIVNRQAIRALDSFHEVYILGGQDKAERGERFFPTTDNDIMGWTQVEDVIDRVKPDAVHIIADPATVMAWLLKENVYTLPVVVYMPIEGAPVNPYWVTMLKDRPPTKVITCTQFGVDALRDNGIDADFAYHGVSDEFKPYPEHVREAQRYSVGWSDKFMVLMVAQNVARKQWPRMLEGLKYAVKRDPSIYLYAHTVPYNYGHLGGHDLVVLSREIGVEDHVIFNEQDMNGHNSSVPLVGSDRPGLVDYYNMADCFVLPSEVEGFGLPLAEAMKCGLPVATTGYGPGAEVVGDAGIHLPVLEYVWDKSHARYAHVDPRGISEAILKMRNPEVRKRMVAKGLERAKLFKWDRYQQILREAFHAIEFPQNNAIDLSEEAA